MVTLDDGYRDNLSIGVPLFEARSVPFTLFAVSGFVKRTVVPSRFVLEAIIRKHNEIVIDGRRHVCGDTHTKALVYSGLTGRPISPRTVERLCADYEIDANSLMDGLFLSAEELRCVARSRLCTIGSHTVSHMQLRKAPASQLAAELRESKCALEEMTSRCVRYLAYPYGSVLAAGSREYRAACDEGYACAFTTLRAGIHRSSSRNIFGLPRVNVSYENTADVDAFAGWLDGFFRP